MIRRFLLAASAAVVAAASLAAQIPSGVLGTTSIHPQLVPDPPDFTFGIETDPDGVHAWITVSGRIAFGPTGNYNNRLLKIDIASQTIVDETTVELFPEDIEIVTDAFGLTERIYVANNGSGSISCVDASLQPVATIALPLCFGTYSQFPFEIEKSVDQTKLYVGTSGCENVFVVDIDPSSPGYHSFAVLANYGGSHGSVTIHPARPQELLVGSSVIFGTFTGGESFLDVLDLSGSSPIITSYPIGGQTTFDFASINDIIPMSGGRVLLVENSQSFARLFIFDLVQHSIVESFDLAAQVPGIANLGRADLSQDEKIVVVTEIDRRVVFFDLQSKNVVATIDSVGSPQPATARYSNDEETLLVTYQNAAEVRFFNGLPQALTLGTSGPAQLGQPFAFVSNGGPANDAVYLAYSIVGSGPSVVSGFNIALTAPIEIFDALPTDALGQGFLGMTVPNIPALVGYAAHLQAFAFQPQNTLRLSNGIDVVVVP